MGKIADKYFKGDCWTIIEEGFDPLRERVSESIFALGNEYMGVRGYFEEGYSGDKLIGSYFNGIYEYESEAMKTGYKGMVKKSHFMVNGIDWLYIRITVDGEKLDIAMSAIKDFRRVLDLKKGILHRELTWDTKSGKTLKVSFERFLSMAEPKLGYQKITIQPLNFDGEVEVETGLDFDTIHEVEGQNFWNCLNKEVNEAVTAILGMTKTTHQKLFSAFKVECNIDASYSHIQEDKFIGFHMTIPVKEGTACCITKKVINYAERDPKIHKEKVWHKGMDQACKLLGYSYDDAVKKHQAYWDEVWNTSDITIEGDDENQQGIRYCIFQMHQTYHGEDGSLNIGAKGLTGEAYNGHTFWDTETCCLPFYIFNNPKAAKNLLEYRYHTLPMAIERAKELDCEGACYPIATLNGKEACTLWQHASIQFQPSTGVAYGIWHYVNSVGDKAFLYSMGIEMLLEISRFLASRGQWSGRSGKFGYYCVMGPDEFQMMVHNNCYTNFMAKKTFEYTLDVIKEMRMMACDELKDMLVKTKVTEDEIDKWRYMAEKMYVPFDEKTGIYEQHDGFFDLPHIDIQSISTEEFPLYHNWSYDRIYRNDMIKQPDVLMFMFLYNQQFSLDAKKRNYYFYEPRCIHESSLSPAIHSILASEIGEHDQAVKFFSFATRMDLDNYNRNTREGLHTTSIAAAWMNIVYGFGGMRSDGEILSFSPLLPKDWKAYSFRIIYKNTVLSIEVYNTSISIKGIKGDAVSVKVYGETYLIDSTGILLQMSKK